MTDKNSFPSENRISIEKVIFDAKNSRDPATRSGILMNMGWCPEFTRNYEQMIHNWDAFDYYP